MSRKKGSKRKKTLARPPKKREEQDDLFGPGENLIPFSSGADGPAGKDEIEEIAQFQREKERMMRAIGAAMRGRDFDSPEDAEVFLSSFAGKEIDEILAETSDSPEMKFLEELDRVYDATDSKEREKIAARVVRKYPRSLDAHLAHARSAGSLPVAERRYRKAIALGEEELGSLPSEAEGHLWGHHEARPWMDAMFELAEVCELRERDDAAADLYRKILHLNEGDNQGVRFSLMRLLLDTGRDAEARELYLDYEDDVTCSWSYTRALLEFRRIRERHPWEVTEEDLVGMMRDEVPLEIPETYSRAQICLERALESNPFMARFLLFPHCAPEEEPAAYKPGSEEEALCYFRDLCMAFNSDPSTFIWLFVTTREWAIETGETDLLEGVPAPPAEFL